MKFAVNMMVGDRKLMEVSYHRTQFEAGRAVCQYMFDDIQNGVEGVYRYVISEI